MNILHGSSNTIEMVWISVRVVGWYSLLACLYAVFGPDSKALEVSDSGPNQSPLKLKDCLKLLSSASQIWQYHWENGRGSVPLLNERRKCREKIILEDIFAKYFVSFPSTHIPPCTRFWDQIVYKG